MKCNHITALVYRLKLTSYLKIACSAPMTIKRPVGRPKDPGSCLERNSIEPQVRAGVEMIYLSDDKALPVVEDQAYLSPHL